MSEWLSPRRLQSSVSQAGAVQTRFFLLAGFPVDFAVGSRRGCQAGGGRQYFRFACCPVRSHPLWEAESSQGRLSLSVLMSPSALQSQPPSAVLGRRGWLQRASGLRSKAMSLCCCIWRGTVVTCNYLLGYFSCPSVLSSPGNSSLCEFRS